MEVACLRISKPIRDVRAKINDNFVFSSTESILIANLSPTFY